MTEAQDLVQIGEFAKLAGTNLRTLRYYEELGLIKPASRSDGGFRMYQRTQLERIAAIKRLQDLGLPLKEIAGALVASPSCGPELVGRLRGALEKQIELIEGKMKAMQSDLDDMSQARQRLLDMCQHCDIQFSPETCDPCPRDHQPIPSMLRALL